MLILVNVREGNCVLTNSFHPTGSKYLCLFNGITSAELGTISLWESSSFKCVLTLKVDPVRQYVDVFPIIVCAIACFSNSLSPLYPCV